MPFPKFLIKLDLSHLLYLSQISASEPFWKRLSTCGNVTLSNWNYLCPPDGIKEKNECRWSDIMLTYTWPIRVIFRYIRSIYHATVALQIRPSLSFISLNSSLLPCMFHKFTRLSTYPYTRSARYNWKLVLSDQESCCQ